MNFICQPLVIIIFLVIIFYIAYLFNKKEDKKLLLDNASTFIIGGLFGVLGYLYQGHLEREKELNANKQEAFQKSIDTFSFVFEYINMKGIETKNKNISLKNDYENKIIDFLTIE